MTEASQRAPDAFARANGRGSSMIFMPSLVRDCRQARLLGREAEELGAPVRA